MGNRKSVYLSSDDARIWKKAERLAPQGNMSQLITRLLCEFIEQRALTDAEEASAMSLLRRERDLQMETVQTVLDWNMQWQQRAREREELLRLQINENIELRRELTAPTTQRPGYQNGMKKLEPLN